MTRDDWMWQRVLARKPDATFVYAVTTTGVFCRSNCPSRRPARARVRFFETAGQAQGAGFRACLRCRPGSASADAELAARVAAFLQAHADRQVPLADLARHAGVSAGTVQRVFTRVMGVSPRVFANSLRAERFRAELGSRRARVTDAVYAAGFSAPSRAQHSASLGMAAKRYRAGGAGEQIGYAVAPAPRELGWMLVAATARGLCAVLLGADAAELKAELGRRFRAATLVEDRSITKYCQPVLAAFAPGSAASELPLDLRGTAFQARVWAALGEIPHGETRSYTQVAASLGDPKAVRAVARACAENPLAIVVPCHRVIGSNGALTGYRWGLERKKALLAWEATERPVPERE